MDLKSIVAGVLLAFLSTNALAADALRLENTDDQWLFKLTPYLWLPNVGGSLRFTLPDGGADASTGPYNYLEHLRFALMLQGEARKGDWSLFADTIYLSFGRHESSVNATDGLFGNGTVQKEFETGLKGTLVQVGGGYTVARLPRASIDAIAGVRYLRVKTTLDASLSVSANRGPPVSPDAHAEQIQNVVDGIAGIRGHISITGDGRWYVPFYLDVGSGTSRITWQAMSGVGYGAKWGDIALTYRYLAFYGSGDQLVQTLRFNGPSVNVSINF